MPKNQVEVLSPEQLIREYDRTQANAFLGDNAAFFGSLLCSLEFSWQETNCDTAQTDGVSLEWNPQFFTSLNTDTRVTVLMHELWHVGLLHPLRRGIRDPKVWNQACDIYINNMLETMGYSFVGIENCWKDKQYAGWTEEDIYDHLMTNPKKQPKSGAFGGSGSMDGDMQTTQQNSPDKVTTQVVNSVTRAMHQQSMAGGKNPGQLPGDMKKVISEYLKPVVNWEEEFLQFFTELLDDDYTWKRPNRRYDDVYLPSRYQEEGKLAHLAYFLDVSGSIRPNDLTRFNSEVKYVKDEFKPLKMSLVQFTTRIVDEQIIEDSDEFDKLTIKGTGGTSLVEVRDWIIKNEPTAAIIFTDMEVRPMEKLPFDTPIIWVVVRNKRAVAPFGKVINID